MFASIDYEHEHRPLRRTEHEHDRILVVVLTRTVAITQPEQVTQRKSQRPIEGLVSIALLWLFIVLVLSIAVLVLVIAYPIVLAR
jgi:hypothetical protein